MSKQADAVVAELQRLERRRRVSTMLAVLVAFVTVAATVAIHSWPVRVAITSVAAVIVWLLARIASRTLDPFTMENATRARRTGVASLKAEATAEKLDDLFETEAAAKQTENKRDEA